MEEITGSIPEENMGKKLTLGQKLHSLQLWDRNSVQDHIKAMIELFNELAKRPMLYIC